MPTDGADTASSSVSPKVIVPSITVISLLVLITFIGAVIIFVRAYKKRRRGQSDVEKQDEEARLATGEPGQRSQERHGSMLNSGRSPREQRFFDKQNETISSLPRVGQRQSRTIPPQEAREIVDQGFHRGRSAGEDKIERVVVAGQGYNVRHVCENGGTEIYDSPGISAVPVIGKIERITGNPLSNDFYTERASGSGHSRSNSASTIKDPKRHSYPVLTTKDLSQRLSSFRPVTLELDTNLSPISPETDISTARDFSPHYEHSNLFKALSPPPAAPAAIALKYPNVSALIRANAPMEPQSRRSSHRSSNRSSNRFSYTQLYGGTNLAEHISSQYNRVKERRHAPDPLVKEEDSPENTTYPPLSAAFGGFNISQKPPNLSRISTGSTDTVTSVESSTRGHAHRLSWNGRSVLELDPSPPAPNKSLSPPPLTPASQSQYHPLRRQDRNLPVEPTTPPKFATAPRVRTSAFGPYRHKNYPPLPPIPPDPEDIASGPGQLILPTPMSRSGSTSKMSVVSVPSTISSFNTITGRTTGGLSPTPARHSFRNTPDQFGDASSNRRSTGTSTILTETSEASNMTAVELELEMRRIRERARRASDERRGNRNRSEERQSSWRVGEGSDNLGVGHRLF